MNILNSLLLTVRPFQARRVVAMAAVAAGLAHASASAVSLSLVPTAASVDAGGTVQLALQVQGLGDLAAPSLGSVDLNVAYDGSVFAFDSGVYGDPVVGDALGLHAASIHDITHDAAGALVNLFSISLDSVSDLEQLQPGAFVLGVLTFKASGLGAGAFSIVDAILADADGNDLAATSLDGATVLVRSAGPHAMPEAGWSGSILFLAGFSGCAAWAGRRKQVIR